MRSRSAAVSTRLAPNRRPGRSSSFAATAPTSSAAWLSTSGEMPASLSAPFPRTSERPMAKAPFVACRQTPPVADHTGLHRSSYPLGQATERVGEDWCTSLFGVLIVLFFILWPLAELFVLVKVAEAIGVLYAILLLLVSWPVGTWVLRPGGGAAPRPAAGALPRGRAPGRGGLAGALVFGRGP